VTVSFSRTFLHTVGYFVSYLVSSVLREYLKAEYDRKELTPHVLSAHYLEQIGADWVETEE
jgi:hypothetical protein